MLQSPSGRGDGRALCYIFESNNDGEKVVVCILVVVVLRVSDPSDRPSSSCVADMRQHRSGQADRLPLRDGEADEGLTLFLDDDWLLWRRLVYLFCCSSCVGP